MKSFINITVVLQGERGFPGDQGVPGVPGEAGAPGPIGPAGRDGERVTF